MAGLPLLASTGGLLIVVNPGRLRLHHLFEGPIQRCRVFVGLNLAGHIEKPLVLSGVIG